MHKTHHYYKHNNSSINPPSCTHCKIALNSKNLLLSLGVIVSSDKAKAGTTNRWQEPEQTWPEGGIAPIPGFLVMYSVYLRPAYKNIQWPQGREALKAQKGWGVAVTWGWVGVYLYLIPAGVGRAGDCIYINTPLKQLRSRTKQQRQARHILMATAAPRRLGTGEPDTSHTGGIELDTT